ncbi:hypothetical protein LAZ67_X001775 [Cordylochernes scorpioides]|uniref:Uncharacterized protein n=1 Tax=Cordylochernes scorpioides TaxID=51811 RepID=A0ABY6LXP1_9ARAC|nr:hypothetical protein LAZ67_X001775 [Cordylochernes scorpioides]
MTGVNHEIVKIPLDPVWISWNKLFGSISLSLVLTYGTPVWLMLGLAYPLFLVATASSLLSSAMLSFSYLLSAHTFAAVRSTWLEVLQNCACCGLLATGSGILGLHTTLFLWPMYLIIPYFQSYPAMLAATVSKCFKRHHWKVSDYWLLSVR